MPRRDAGGFSPFQLAISTGIILLLVAVYFLLGPLGWSWWVRILVIVGGLFALNGILLACLGRRDPPPADPKR